MAKPDLDELERVVATLAQTWRNVTTKRMFGCPGFWVNGNIFALVWKTGRIGVRLPDKASFSELMSAAGAEPWKAGTMTMSHWVLTPPAYHSSAELKRWLKRAYELNDAQAPENPKRSRA